jgi:hypothetical protein
MRSNDNKRHFAQTTLSFVNTASGVRWRSMAWGKHSCCRNVGSIYDLVLNSIEEMTDAELYLQLPPESQHAYKGMQGDSATIGLS